MLVVIYNTNKNNCLPLLYLSTGLIIPILQWSSWDLAKLISWCGSASDRAEIQIQSLQVHALSNTSVCVEALPERGGGDNSESREKEKEQIIF